MRGSRGQKRKFRRGKSRGSPPLRRFATAGDRESDGKPSTKEAARQRGIKRGQSYTTGRGAAQKACDPGDGKRLSSFASRFRSLELGPDKVADDT